MSTVFLDGFDKYGIVGTALTPALFQNEWTSFTTSGGTYTFKSAAPLSSTGYAISFVATASYSAFKLSKTLSQNYSRLIGGFRYTLTNGSSSLGLSFFDGTTLQCSIWCTSVNWYIGTGPFTGIYQSVVTPSNVSTVHYVEFDITFGPLSPYTIMLDGVTIITGTHSTINSANNYADDITLGNAANATSNTGCSFDDFYLFDATGSTNNSILGTNPHIETQFPISSVQHDFLAIGAPVGTVTSSLGTGVQTSGAAATANWLYLYPITMDIDGTIKTIQMFGFTGGYAFKAVVYSDDSGVPGILLSSSINVNSSASSYFSITLNTPQTFTAGTKCWIGIFSVNGINAGAGAISGVKGALIASGTPPTIAPVMSSAANYVINAIITPVQANHVNLQTNDSDVSYISSSNIGDEDRYQFTPVTSTNSDVVSTAVKIMTRTMGAGVRNLSIHTASNGADSTGTVSSITPLQTYGYFSTYIDIDPDGDKPWTGTALNASTSGVVLDA